MFFSYKAIVEKQFGHQIQKFIRDDGGEYVNNIFTTYCTAQGIQMKIIVPNMPQQNIIYVRRDHT